MKIHYSDKFQLTQTSLMSSWSWVKKSFAEDFEMLSKSGVLRENGGAQIIWSTKQKYVLKVSCNGRNYVFKSYRKVRDIRKYLFRLSPCGFEAYNYQQLAAAGLPMAKVLAAGDTRYFFRLKNMFLMTEFAENFRDGRDFQPGGNLFENTALREEYIVRNLQLLAKCHDAGFVHAGFTPANLLYQVRETPDEQGNNLKLCWIDVATARRFSLLYPPRKMITDHIHFFRFLDIRGEDLRRYLQIYCDAVQVKRLSYEHLLKLLSKNRTLFPDKEK